MDGFKEYRAEMISLLAALALVCLVKSLNPFEGDSHFSAVVLAYAVLVLATGVAHCSGKASLGLFVQRSTMRRMELIAREGYTVGMFVVAVIVLVALVLINEVNELVGPLVAVGVCGGANMRRLIDYNRRWSLLRGVKGREKETG